MTTADRLRKAVEAALPEGFYVIDPMHGKIADIDCSLRALVLAAVQPIVEELERDRERLRAVLDWTQHPNARYSHDPLERAHSALEAISEVAAAAIERQWPAVRAAGVALPGEEG